MAKRTRVRTRWRPRAVLDPVRRAEQRVGKQFGFRVMQRARGSIRNGGAHATSPAGAPPTEHLGILRQWILYGWEAKTRTTVIGPKLLNRPSPALGELERGGTASILRGGRGKHRAERRNVTFRPHPFMGPALLAELRAGTLETLWSNAVR